MKRAAQLALTMVAVVSCGDSGSANETGGDASMAETGGSSGVGGHAGAGGTSGVGGFETSGLCPPMSGCSSYAGTGCTIGCNEFHCVGTTWVPISRCILDAQTDGPTGTCEQDSDCEFRKTAGCCGSCLARTDPTPPGGACTGVTQCPPYQPNCVCIDHRCGGGSLTQTQACDESHDLCSLGLKCCPACDGATAKPDGDSGCSNSACSIAIRSPSGPNACSP